MLPLNRILHPTDFSPVAEAALAAALDMAVHFGAELHVLHVLEDTARPAASPDATLPAEDNLDIRLHEVVNAQLGRLHRTEQERLRVEYSLEHDLAPAPAIVRYAGTHRAGLIVMGTHGRHGVQRLFMGSVAERTVRRASCSVLTVREQPASKQQAKKPVTRQINRILVPLDYSEHSEAMLRVACALAESFEAQLDLLHVVEMPLFVGIYSGVLTAGDFVPDLRERSHEKLQRLWEQVHAEGVVAKLHVEEGHATARIIDFAARCGTDLIVIASQGRSGLERFLIGSVTERVVRFAECPVLTFRPVSAGVVPPDARDVAAAQPDADVP